MGVELYKHNKKAYENVVEHFKTTNRTCVIHPTGSGKSFISLKYIDDNKNNNILVLAPTYPILDQFNKNIAKDILDIDIDNLNQEQINSIVASRLPNITFSIYSNVDKLSNEKFDNIIMDEFHRVGAEVWGLGVNHLLSNNENAKILGVTATPIRYLDDFRDMSKEIFNGDISSEITLAQAIAWGILPAPTYVSAVYSFDDELNKIEKKINNYKDSEKKNQLIKKLQEARKFIEKSEGLSQVFSNHIEKPNGKYIVFCRNIEHMQKMEEEAKKWFENINKELSITEVHTYNDRIVNQESISQFEKDDSSNLKLLFSIQMLNEGLHVDDIDGVIMLRPTTSPIIYFQQLGRALSVGHNSNPLVFDIVNNYEENIQIYNLYKDVLEEIQKIKRGYVPPIDTIDGNGGIRGPGGPGIDEDDILKKFKIFDEMINLRNQLKELDEEASFTWDDYYKLAKAYYETNGHLRIKWAYRTFDGINEVKPDDPRYEEAIQLGSWINTQRNAKKNEENNKRGGGIGRITPEHIKMLDDIGMIWEVFENSWNEMYQIAKTFYDHNNHLNIPVSYRTFDGITEIKKDDPRYEEAIQLGMWLATQRQAKRGTGNYAITDEQIRLLEEIGIVWEKTEDFWNMNYELAKAYNKSHGHLNIPNKYRTFDGITEVKPDDPRYEEAVQLGSWLGVQRGRKAGVRKGKITDEQIKLLDDIGMIWDLAEYTWNENFKIAKAFYDHNGHLNMRATYRTFDGITEIKPDDPRYEEAIPIGTWITSQRMGYTGKAGLTEEHLRKLESIGMVWYGKESFDDKAQKEEITKDNIDRKKKEIYNRFISALNTFSDDDIPSSEDINREFMDQLNHTSKKR